MFGALFAASNHCLLGGLLGLDSTSLFPLSIFNNNEHFLPKTEILAKHKPASSVESTSFLLPPQQSTTPTTIHHNLFSTTHSGSIDSFLSSRTPLATRLNHRSLVTPRTSKTCTSQLSLSQRERKSSRQRFFLGL
jgi:hypothetical protein